MLKHKNILGSVAIAGLLASGAAWADGSYNRTDRTEAQTQQQNTAELENLRAASENEVRTSTGQTISNDMKIVDAVGDEIGNVKEVLVNESNTAAAVVVEVDNYADLNDKQLVVDLDRATLDADQERIVVAMSADQLRSLPEWNETNR